MMAVASKVIGFGGTPGTILREGASVIVCGGLRGHPFPVASMACMFPPEGGLPSDHSYTNKRHE